MKQLTTTIYIILSICLGINGLFAQREVTLYMMENVYQASYVNPAVIPQSEVSIGLPGIASVHFGEALSFSAKNVMDGNVASPTKLINNSKKGVYSLTAADVDLLSARLKVKHWYFNFSARARAYQNLMIDKDVLDLAWNGNGDLLGQDISLKHMRNNTTAYKEIGFGASRQFGKWTFGAKLKANFGVANISNAGNDASLYFDPDTYEARMDGEYVINTSSLPHVDDSNDIEKEDFLKLNTKNFGLSIDLGASYKINDRLEVSASLVDLGYIKWADNPQNYNMKVDGVVSGADAIGAIIKGGDTDSIWDAWADGLEDQADYTSTQNSYTTMLHGQFYLNGKYKVGDKIDAYGTVNVFLWKGLRTSATVGIRKEFGRSFSMTVNNTVQYKRLVNIGLGFMVKPGPFQFYMVFDNLYMGNFIEYKNADAPMPQYVTNVNMRLGVNLVFGKVHNEDKIL